MRSVPRYQGKLSLAMLTVLLKLSISQKYTFSIQIMTKIRKLYIKKMTPSYCTLT